METETMTCSKCGLTCETVTKVSDGRGQKLSLCCNAPAERKK